MAYVGDLLKKPYQEGGRGNPGYDCYGLMLEVEKRFGNMMPDFDYNTVDVHDIKKQVQQLVDEKKCVKTEWLEPADMLVFRNTSGFAFHVGVYMGDGMFIHTTNRGVAMSKIAAYEDGIMGKYKWQK